MICVFCRSPIEDLEGDESNFGVCVVCEETELSGTTQDGDEEPKIILELAKHIFRDPRER